MISKIKSTNPDVIEKTFRKNYQKGFTKALNDKLCYNPEAYMRNRLDRYEFNIFPRFAAMEAMKALDQLSSTAQPKVRAAVLGTLWNRWMTQDKMGNGKNAKALHFKRNKRYMLGCGYGNDSLDHYAVCCKVSDAGRSWLGLRKVEDMVDRRSRFFLVDRNLKTEAGQALLRGASLIYAMYSTHNFYRYHPHRSPAFLMEVLIGSKSEKAPAAVI